LTNDKDEKIKQPQDSAAPKKPYETPKLTEHGKLAELTRGTGTLHTADALGLSV
jgi:hypothetical protein